MECPDAIASPGCTKAEAKNGFSDLMKKPDALVWKDTGSDVAEVCWVTSHRQRLAVEVLVK